MIRKRFKYASNRHRDFHQQTSQVPSRYNTHARRAGWNERRPHTIEFYVEGQPEQARGVYVTYTDDPIEGEAWLTNNVLDIDTRALGFDIEWKPQFIKKKLGGKENKTAVLQLSTETTTLVLHIIHLKILPRNLANILAREDIIKVGCGIRNDVLKLFKDTYLQCKGVVDLVDLASRSGYTKQHGQGLKTLALNVLGIEMNKPKRVQLSNWETLPLSRGQIHYAALDAWVGIKLYLQMRKKMNNGQNAESQVDGLIDAEPSDVDIVYCDVCGKKCKGQHKLQEHMATACHSQCPNCGMMFVFTVTRKHRNMCTGSRRESSSQSAI